MYSLFVYKGLQMLFLCKYIHIWQDVKAFLLYFIVYWIIVKTINNRQTQNRSDKDSTYTLLGGKKYYGFNRVVIVGIPVSRSECSSRTHFVGGSVCEYVWLYVCMAVTFFLQNYSD